MKSLLNNRYIYKISSSRLSSAGWDIAVTRGDAVKNNELIGIASSNALRMIDKLNGNDGIDSKITLLKNEVKRLKKSKTSENVVFLRSKVNELNRLNFMSDIVFVVMDSKKDYDRANKGFKINGIDYVRLLATSGGVKKSTVIYCNKEIRHDLYSWFNNERDLKKEFVPAKLEAYISLVFSSSIPVSNPNGILVVHDVETAFKDDVILVDGNVGKRPKVETVQDYETKLNACDGMGLMSPELSERWSKELHEDYVTSGVCLRNAFLKGMVYTFDFKLFAQEVAKNKNVVDVWGNSHNIDDIELVITTSMLKLWDSYNDINHYLKCCATNNFEFSVTKIIDEELDNEQTMNYQFLQSLELTDEDIYNLCKPTIDEFHDVLGFDYRKSLLFLRGKKMTVENVIGNMNDFTSALMVDEELINDKYVFSKIRNAIKKRIDDAKLGVIKVRGNFSLVSGDPYILCESMFGLKLTGLLKRGEFYSKFWNDTGVSKVTLMRAPMSVHNNIVIGNFVYSDDIKKWYKYMPCVTIFNAWDNTCSALNGCDMDGDTVFTTDNKYVLKGIDENVLPIVCVQSSSPKKKPTEKDFIHANKMSFGSGIGSITNIATSMYNVISNFEKGSKEWVELDYRIKCMQNYQQNEIDKAKGIVSEPVPKEWYDYKINKIEPNDSEEVKKEKKFNLSILANKKPYFFIYNYDQTKSEFLKFNKSADDVCIMKYGIDAKTLLKNEEKTEQESEFINNYVLKSPVNVTNCTMNKIAMLFEEEFDKNNRHKFIGYNKDNFKTDKKYNKEHYDAINMIVREFSEVSKKLIKISKSNVSTDVASNEIQTRSKLIEFYSEKIHKTNIETEDLCNIIVDICYTSDKSKQFAWQVVGDTMIKNMIKNTKNNINVPVSCESGDIYYCGEKFKMVEVNLGESSL